MKKILSLTAILLLTLSCSSNWITLTNDVDTPPEKFKKSTISDDACGFMLLGFIPIMINSRYERAWKGIVYQARDGFIDKISMEERWTYYYIGTGYCTEFTAVVLRPVK